MKVVRLSKSREYFVFAPRDGSCYHNDLKRLDIDDCAICLNVVDTIESLSNRCEFGLTLATRQ